jgi:phi13 family phage major tail protein
MAIGAYAPIIGVDAVYVAPLTAGTDTFLVAPSWGTVTRISSGVVKIAANPNGTVVTDWGDNGPFVVMNGRVNLQLTMELQDFDLDLKAAILGQTKANGITAEDSLDQAPYYAVGYRIWRGTSDPASVDAGKLIYEYVWHLKGKATLPETSAETYKGTPAPQHTTISWEFARSNFNGKLTTIARTNDTTVPAATITGWFTAPVYTTSASFTAVTVGTATGSISAKTFTIPFAKSGETFSIANGITSNDIQIMVVSTGLILAGTATYAVSAAGIAPTVIVTTPTTLTAVPYLVLVESSVKDNNGVAVTAKSQLVTPA